MDEVHYHHKIAIFKYFLEVISKILTPDELSKIKLVIDIDFLGDI